MSTKREVLNTDLLIKINQNIVMSNAVSILGLKGVDKTEMTNQFKEITENLGKLIDKSIELDMQGE